MAVDSGRRGRTARKRNLATSADLSNVTGEYFDQQRRSQAHQQAYDKKAREKLWDLSVALTGLSLPGMSAQQAIDFIVFLWTLPASMPPVSSVFDLSFSGGSEIFLTVFARFISL